MPTTKPDANTCPSCSESYPRGVAVCPECKVILVKPDGRAKTPVWLIVLLLVIIAALSVWLVFELKRVFIDRETRMAPGRVTVCAALVEAQRSEEAKGILSPSGANGREAGDARHA